MSHVRHTARLLRHRGRPDLAHELHPNPQPEHQEGGHGDNEEEDDDVDPVARKEYEVGPEHAGDGPGRAKVGHEPAGIGRDLRDRRREAAAEVEQQKRAGPEAVLDVVAEDPEVEQVAAEVPEAAVHEHRREHREVDQRRVARPAALREVRGRADLGRRVEFGDGPVVDEVDAGRDLGRDEAPGVRECGVGDLVREHGDVGEDEQDRDHGGAV